MRFDPVWRRITGDAYTGRLEGRFAGRRDRLDGLSNWGVLRWLYPHAGASKLEHHYGVEHNACEFLSGGDGTRDKYRDSFRVAAHVLHWGHLPLSYAAEEAILRAAHVNAEIARLLKGIFKEVVAAGELNCETEEHDCVASVLNGDRYQDLYRWLAAWLVVVEWKRLWNVIRDVSHRTPDEQCTKHDLLATLVCRKDRGYRILSMCNRADFVPRDLLQAGTAWLSFDIATLWESNPLGSDAAKEWSLIAAAEEYLDDRFFRVPNSLLLHSLVSRAIAGGLLAQGVNRDLLKTLLKSDDTYYETKLTNYHRKRLINLRSLATKRRLGNRWTHVGSWMNVSLPAGSRFEMEDHLTGRVGGSRISYPFTEGISVIVERRSTMPDVWAGPGHAFATVHLHQEAKDEKNADRGFAALRVVSKVAVGLPPGHEPGNSIMSWLLKQPTEQSDNAVSRVTGEILGRNEIEARSITRELVRLKMVEKFMEQGPPWQLSFLRSFSDGAQSRDDLEEVGALFLRLPWPILKLAKGRALMELIRREAARRASARRGERGYALEVATIADQWLAPGDSQQRFVFFNCYMLGKDQQRETEFDVVRVDLAPDRSWCVTAVECAVARSNSKDDEARAKLDLVGRRLQGRFSDMSAYVTLLAEPNGDGVAYEDARRGFSNSV